MLAHERPDVLPSRPRMCERRGRLRDVEAPAGATAPLECVECGATERGRAWLAGGARPDDAGFEELEVPLYCAACWAREFGPSDV